MQDSLSVRLPKKPSDLDSSQIWLVIVVDKWTIVQVRHDRRGNWLGTNRTDSGCLVRSEFQRLPDIFADACFLLLRLFFKSSYACILPLDF